MRRMVKALFYLMLLAFFAIVFVLNSAPLDILWTIPTGQAILKHGILYTNPWIIDQGFAIVIQQWLYDVFIAWLYGFGRGWVYLAGIACGICLFVTGARYLRSHNVPAKAAYMLSGGLCIAFANPLVQIRPEGVTVLLLLSECIALERCLQEKQWLPALPIAMVLEANVHSSMIWFHFAIAAAYLVPSLKESLYADSGLHKDKTVWFAVVGMVPAMFLNPYGIKGVTYLFDSVCSGTFTYVSLIHSWHSGYETNGIGAAGTLLLCLIACSLAYLLRRKALKSYQLYLALGFGLTVILMRRNGMFLYLVFLVLLPDLYAGLTQADISGRISGSVSGQLPSVIVCQVTILCCLCVVGVPYVSKFYALATGSDAAYAAYVANDESLVSYDAYIRERSGTDAKLFVGYVFGEYFEYLGYSNILMDCRPELYMKAINGSKDLLKDYTYLCCVYDPEAYDYGEDPGDAVQAFLDGYGFDYLVVFKPYETLLLEYLMQAGEESGYRIAVSGEYGYLYEKI